MGVKRPAGKSAREYAENIPDKDQRADFARAARAAMLYAYAQIEAAVMAPKVTSNGRAVSVAGEVFGLH